MQFSLLFSHCIYSPQINKVPQLFKLQTSQQQNEKQRQDQKKPDLEMACHTFPADGNLGNEFLFSKCQR